MQRAQIISEALPYIRQWHGKTIVIKYGGAAMLDDTLRDAVLGDIALLRYVGINPLVVHGGGPAISATCQKMGIEPHFEKGLRVTDEATMQVTEMVLGQIGKNIARGLEFHGASAVGISGKDGNLLHAHKLEGDADWGFVGKIDDVQPHLLNALARDGFVPVVSPIAPGDNNTTYNINADLAAASIASSLGAVKLLLLTDIAGIMRDVNDSNSLIPSLHADEAEQLIDDGTVAKGMIPKVRCCVDAVRSGVERAQIVDGREPHAILVELFTDHGCGTMIEP